MIANLNEGGTGGRLDPFQVAHEVEELFARGAISLFTFRVLVRQCHEALRTAPKPDERTHESEPLPR